MDENFKSRLRKVKSFFFDMDGVMTDGSLLVMPDGELLRSMNIKDGYALKKAATKGYRVIVISGSHSKGATVRLKDLGLTDVYFSVEDKLAIFKECCNRYHLKKEETLFMGDDMPDLKVMEHAGIPACPADAIHQVKARSIYVSPYGGGKGCVRDIIEQVMTAQGQWD